MYKIFINDYPLIITSNEADFYAGGNYRMIDDSTKSMLNAAELLEASERGVADFGLVVITDNPQEAFARYSAKYSTIHAAGGLVFNERGELLLILRQGKWDLPKGKVDKGETIEEAAVREVMEECGLKGLSILEPVDTMYHTYFQGGKRMLKHTHWFTMMALDTSNMKPQLEENITELGWFNPDTLNIEQLDTYNSIREILNRLLDDESRLR